MKKLLISFSFLTILVLSFTACKDEEKTPEKPAVPSNPTEIITTVKLLLEEEGTGNLVTATWKDADGDGPGQPVITPLALSAGKTYQGTVLLLDESKSPVDTISNEVEEEHNVHQFFYTLSGDASSRVSITKQDKDDNNLPVGLSTKITVSAGNSAEGSLKLVLKHYDGVNKSADESIGDTDVDATFPLSVQ